MAAIAALSLSDGTATRTFTPQNKVDGITAYTDFAVTSPDLRPVITHSVKAPSGAGVVGRVKEKISFSYLDANSVVKTGFINIEAVIPKDMVESDRGMLRELARATLNSSTPLGLAIQRFEDTY